MTTPKTYQKKPVKVQAVHWDGTGASAVPILNWLIREGCRSAWWRDQEGHALGPGRGVTSFESSIEIEPFGRDMFYLLPGDWIVLDAHGEFFRCTPEVFEAVYEEVGTK